MTKSECQGDHHRSIDSRYSGFGIRHWNSFVILRSAFSFRPAISPPTQLLQLIRRGQEKASVQNVRLPDQTGELVEVAG